MSNLTGAGPDGNTTTKKVRRDNIFLIVLGALTLLWVVFIFSNSLRSGEDSSETSGWVLALLQKVFPEITEHFVRKAAHFTEFAVLGVLGTLTFTLLLKRFTGLSGAKIAAFGGYLLLFGVAVPLTDETLQYFSVDRGPEVRDVLLDFGGFMTGLAAAALAVFIAVKVKRRVRSKSARR